MRGDVIGIKFVRKAQFTALFRSFPFAREPFETAKMRSMTTRATFLSFLTTSFVDKFWNLLRTSVFWCHFCLISEKITIWAVSYWRLLRKENFCTLRQTGVIHQFRICRWVRLSQHVKGILKYNRWYEGSCEKSWRWLLWWLIFLWLFLVLFMENTSILFLYHCRTPVSFLMSNGTQPNSITSGTNQGSGLGPVLFLKGSNFLDEAVTFSRRIFFVDDEDLHQEYLVD